MKVIEENKKLKEKLEKAEEKLEQYQRELNKKELEINKEETKQQDNIDTDEIVELILSTRRAYVRIVRELIGREFTKEELEAPKPYIYILGLVNELIVRYYECISNVPIVQSREILHEYYKEFPEP